MTWEVHPYFVLSRKWHPEVTFDHVRAALNNVASEHVQADGRIRRWGYVPELGHYLRVVLLQDRRTILNAFVDRDYERRYRR